MDGRHRFTQPVNQYSHQHHLSRTVCCVQCGCQIVKDHQFVLRGRRCWGCWQGSEVTESGVVTYTASHEVLDVFNG